VTELENLLNYQNLSENTARTSGNTAVEYRKESETAYYNFKNTFTKNRVDFRLLDLNAKKEDISAIIIETYQTTKRAADAIKNFRNYVDYMAEDSGKASNYTSYQDTLSTETGTINGHLSSLLSSTTNIKTYQDAFLNTNLDVQSSELSVKQKENALQDAKDALLDYSVYAPFGGTISAVAIKKSDSVSSGTSIATLITDKQVAEISLNEVDAAKIKIDQKATITFDAIADLTITGKVVEIDSVGTVSSGVVNYTIKINFDTNDIRIKPGMSASATIIADIKQDVLTVSNSAIKIQSGKNYVETFDAKLATPVTRTQGSTSLVLPNKKGIAIGISNDTMTEITSGLNEGDVVVIKTITGATSTTTTSSLFNTAGGNKAGSTTGSAMRTLH
jgi:HlyD family secretion protein